MTIHMGGLISNQDTASLIEQLMAVEAKPLERMTEKKQSLQSKLSAWQLVNSRLLSFQTTVEALQETSLWNSRSVTSGNSSILTGSASTGAANGIYNITINNMATASKIVGTSDVGTRIDETALLSQAGFATAPTTGTFTINDVGITVEDTDTVNSVLQKINTAFGGAVTASYDSGADKITITHTSAPLVLGAIGDTSNFLSVAKLFGNGTNSVTSSNKLGTVGLFDLMNDGGANGARLTTPVVGGGADTNTGSFTINGTTITYDVTTNAVDDVLDRINESDAGVTATYDALLDRFILTSKSTGALGVAASDVEGNFLAALGLTTSVTLGEDASVTIEGINGGNPIQSNSNTFTSAETGISGLTFDILADSGSTSLTVATDTATIRSAIDDFIGQYNATMALLEDESHVTSSGELGDEVDVGRLQGDTLVSSMMRRLRSTVSEKVSGISGETNYLGAIGIWTTGREAALSVTDESTLTQALEQNLETVRAIFADETSGVATKLESYLNSHTETGSGIVPKREQGITNQINELDESIQKFNDHLDQAKEQYWAQFTAMEEAILQMQGDLGWLLNQLGYQKKDQ